jgi:hypothetical protein
MWQIRPGDRYRFPSGNLIDVLVDRGSHFECRYSTYLSYRGELNLSRLFIQRFGERAS